MGDGLRELIAAYPALDDKTVSGGEDERRRARAVLDELRQAGAAHRR